MASVADPADDWFSVWNECELAIAMVGSVLKSEVWTGRGRNSDPANTEHSFYALPSIESPSRHRSAPAFQPADG